MSAPREASRLAAERSPFLLHGATQPVEWWPWGEAAFERARAEDRPVLLDIGAVWCHWCHVMDAESYEHAETARLINELFVPIKVDRDERPDVDARYQRAVQALTGQGGWPLTAFLTPDGEVYYGGTYFPPDERYGRPSFRRVLLEVSRVWRDERARATDAARGIQTRLEQFARAEVQPGAVAHQIVADTLEELAHSFDFRFGGFGRAPKFPNAGALDLLLDEWLDSDTQWARRIVAETLTAMARGGIYDQLGGGFHRYSTDARWLVPHFEKMAYDNGVLLETYARAASVIDDPLLQEVVRGIPEYYRDVAAALVEDGGFPASQDADYGFDNDGDYWTWTLDELERALGDERLFQAARLHYGLDDDAGAMHSDASRHVLFRAREPHEVAASMSEADAAETTALLREARSRLKAVRDARPAPFVDDTLYTGWVAMVAAGHIAAARHLGVQNAGAAGLRALERIVRDGFGRDGLRRRIGDEGSESLLEDHAFVASAFVDAHQLTQSERWLQLAEDVIGAMLRHFQDPESGALADRATDAGGPARPLSERHLPITDSPSPSGNGVAALTLLRLHHLTGQSAYRDAAEHILRAFAGSAPRLGSGAATYVRAASWWTLPVTTIVVVDAAAAAESELLRAALATHRPRTVVRLIAPGSDASALPSEVRAMLSGDWPRAYVCAGTACAAPVAETAALRELMRTFRAS